MQADDAGDVDLLAAEYDPIMDLWRNEGFGGVCCVHLSPNAELKNVRQRYMKGVARHSKHTMESHDPVHKLIASLLTPRQLTRLS